jgi:hypothetical protein
MRTKTAKKSISSGPLANAIHGACLMASGFMAVAHFDALQKDAGTVLLPVGSWLPSSIYHTLAVMEGLSFYTALIGLVAQLVAEKYSTVGLNCLSCKS